MTVAFVMLAEVLIFVPSIARFRADFLTMRLEKAQIAALAQLAAEDMVTPELEAELLANAAVYNVVLRRDEVRGKTQANRTHFEVGNKVRQTIQELGGTMPENLPKPETSIQQIASAKKTLEKKKP